MNRYEQIAKTKAYASERAPCAVVALSVLCHIPFKDAQKALLEAGRKKGRSTEWDQLVKAFDLCGFKLVKICGKPEFSKTPITYTRNWTVEKFGSHNLLEFSGHVGAAINGEVLDWTKGRRHRIIGIYGVSKKC